MLVQESFSPSAIAKANAIIRGQLEKKDKKVKKSMDLTKDIEIKKISSDLARFLAAAAGWAMSDDVNRENVRIIYENDEIGVEHFFVKFKDGNKQAVMAVHKFKDGKIISLETGATNIPQ